MVSMVDTHLYNAMRKYGWDNFKFEVIATAEDKETLDELESYFIRKYDTIKMDTTWHLEVDIIQCHLM